MIIQIQRGVWINGTAHAVGDVVEVADGIGEALIRANKAQQWQEPETAVVETTAVEPPENAALPAAPRTTATRRKGKVS